MPTDPGITTALLAAIVVLVPTAVALGSLVWGLATKIATLQTEVVTLKGAVANDTTGRASVAKHGEVIAGMQADIRQLLDRISRVPCFAETDCVARRRDRDEVA